MAAQAVCPVVGTTNNVLPPHHPAMSSGMPTPSITPPLPSTNTLLLDPEARCPVTNAKVSHHGSDIIHNHPSDPTVPASDKEAMDASACPALKSAAKSETVTDATCPVVGPVNAHLPPTHPVLEEKEAGAVCPVTNATLGHHKGKVLTHPKVESDAPAQKCPVVGGSV